MRYHYKPYSHLFFWIIPMPIRDRVIVMGESERGI